MPHYYFHLHDETITQDDEGCDLPDLDSARASAIRDARSLMSSQVLDGHLDLDHWVEITNGNGSKIDEVSFRSAIKITGLAAKD